MEIVEPSKCFPTLLLSISCTHTLSVFYKISTKCVLVPLRIVLFKRLTVYDFFFRFFFCCSYLFLRIKQFCLTSAFFFQFHSFFFLLFLLLFFFFHFTCSKMYCRKEMQTILLRISWHHKFLFLYLSSVIVYFVVFQNANFSKACMLKIFTQLEL